MKNIPYLLILSRALIGVLIVILSINPLAHYGIIISSLILFGFLTDVFDGIIARKLNISTEKLRVYDSNVDVFFWVAIILSVFWVRSTNIQDILLPILILISLEILAYVISFIKFKKTIATHSILAKIWSVSLLVFIIELAFNATHHSFYVCFILGVVSRIEIIAIILVLKKWATDIPSLKAAIKINKGIPVKKNKLLNS